MTDHEFIIGKYIVRTLWRQSNDTASRIEQRLVSLTFREITAVRLLQNISSSFLKLIESEIQPIPWLQGGCKQQFAASSRFQTSRGAVAPPNELSTDQ